MIAGRFAQSLKQQDWATVMVEIIVVVVGVYLGIFIGEAQEEREIQREVNRSLVVMLDQMKADLVQLDEVITAQQHNMTYYQSVLQTLEDERVDENMLGQHMQTALHSNRTFYPNESAYQSMRDMGYLSQVRDSKLVMAITVYFDSVLERHWTNANAIDDLQGTLQSGVRDQFFDRRLSKFLGDEELAKARLWNGFRRMWGNAEYYVEITKDLVRPQLVSSIAAIEAYLGEQAD